MARAETITWLPLDRFAEIVGINPLHFNQCHLQNITSVTTNCGEPWFQNDWQNADRVSRDVLAEAIKRAESLIADQVGYNLIPDWNYASERVRTKRLRAVGMFATIYNARGQERSVELNKGFYISGGQRRKTLIESAVAVVDTDGDGDGWNELCTVTVAADCAVCQIHAYLPGWSGDDRYEIRPITVTDVGGGLYTIVFKRWQIVKPSLQGGFTVNSLDATTDANFETTIDVYQIDTNPEDQCTLYWEPDTCETEATTQSGMLNCRDARLGIVTYRPATWDADTTTFESDELAICRDPDYLDVYYRSGWDWKQGACSKLMDPYWEQAVAHLAVTLLDRKICSCNNVEWWFQHWREDLALANDSRTFNIPLELLDNPFGTTRGAIDAWKRCKDPGRRLP